MVGKPITCARDSLTVSVFAVPVEAAIIMEQLEKGIDFLLPSDRFLSHFLSQELIVNLIFDIILELIKLVKDLPDIVQALSLGAFLDIGFRLFDRRQ